VVGGYGSGGASGQTGAKGPRRTDPVAGVADRTSRNSLASPARGASSQARPDSPVRYEQASGSQSDGVDVSFESVLLGGLVGFPGGDLACGAGESAGDGVGDGAAQRGDREPHRGHALGTTGRCPAGAPAWVCALGLLVRDDGGDPRGTRAGRRRGTRGGRSWLEAEAPGDGGAAVLEMVEAGGDAGGLEERSGTTVRLVWARASRSRCMPSSQSWTRRLHSGTRASSRPLSGATSVRTPSSRRLAANGPSRSRRAVPWSSTCARCARPTGPSRGTGRARAGQPGLVRVRARHGQAP
jgi:hypothetical protein